MNNPQGSPISGMPSRRSAWRTMALLALVLSASHFLVFGIARLLIATREPYVFAEAVLRVSAPADLVASIVATPAFAGGGIAVSALPIPEHGDARCRNG